MRLATAAAYLDMTPSAFLSEVAHHRLPASSAIGGGERWDRRAIDDFLDGASEPVRDWRLDQPGLNPELTPAPSSKRAAKSLPDRDAYTATTIAEYWGCSVSLVYSLIRSGELKAFKVGSLYRIRRGALMDFEAGVDDVTARSL